MSKRKSGLGEVIFIALAWGISSLFGFVAANLIGVIITTCIVVAFWFWLKSRRKKNDMLALEIYKRSLLDKYNNNEVVVGRILNSAEQ